MRYAKPTLTVVGQSVKLIANSGGANKNQHSVPDGGNISTVYSAGAYDLDE